MAQHPIGNINSLVWASCSILALWSHSLVRASQVQTCSININWDGDVWHLLIDISFAGQTHHHNSIEQPGLIIVINLSVTLWSWSSSHWSVWIRSKSLPSFSWISGPRGNPCTTTSSTVHLQEMVENSYGLHYLQAHDIGLWVVKSCSPSDQNKGSSWPRT